MLEFGNLAIRAMGTYPWKAGKTGNIPYLQMVYLETSTKMVILLGLTSHASFVSIISTNSTISWGAMARSGRVTSKTQGGELGANV
jgi:hypothetical protein